MSKATKNVLDELHGEYVAELKAQLEEAKEMGDFREVMSVLKEIRLFLKDNDITCEVIPENFANEPALSIDEEDMKYIDISKSVK